MLYPKLRSNLCIAAFLAVFMLFVTYATSPANAQQTLGGIVGTVTDTQGAAQVANLPYITANANAVDVQSVFAIEEVVDPNGFEFLQLQYVQTALLQFGGMCFPHVTVGTLIKAF